MKFWKLAKITETFLFDTRDAHNTEFFVQTPKNTDFYELGMNKQVFLHENGSKTHKPKNFKHVLEQKSKFYEFDNDWTRDNDC